MSRKRPSLFGEAGATPQASATTVPLVMAEAAPNTAKREAPRRPPSRQGKRMVSVYAEPEAVKQLGILAIRGDTSVQALMVEALNDLFAKRGMNRIA